MRRHVDPSALATLVLQLPLVILSLGFMAAIGESAGQALLGHAGIGTAIVLVLWIASGALIFQRPVEVLLARVVGRARRPQPREHDLLQPLWNSVTRTAGVDGTRYQLWISESDEVSAAAVAGHLVLVTRAALQALPPRELAAVLAHELGHHLGGHVWAAALAYWYSLPCRILARLAVLFIRLVTVVTAAILTGLLAFTRLGFLAALFFHPLLWLCTAFMVLMYSPLIVMVVVPLALLRWCDRLGELRADGTAAELGYGHDLRRVFEIWQAQGLDEPDVPPGVRPTLGERLNALQERLFDTHPPLSKRIAALSLL
ncbi:M48 family metalloprotease [Tenggerimyces flavus]|uniref:M48 family metalloprotease n=1 Tax=Tenggerimyces flavus TaxID=1708749 RepID=A0ABV7YDF0_9ACTN|nr:M48 family metalloprotease [Tenggerimyces flavus]MBM7788029.1 STE24 endopeptidase [Tenggerimyces flavus]